LLYFLVCTSPIFMAVHRAFLFYHCKFFDKNTNCSTCWDSPVRYDQAVLWKTLTLAIDVAGILGYCFATLATGGCAVWFDALQRYRLLFSYVFGSLRNMSSTCYNFSLSLAYWDLRLSHQYAWQYSYFISFICFQHNKLHK